MSLLRSALLTIGVKVLEAIDITDKNELFAGNMLAFVTVHQHAGLAFLMLKRYKDAARILNEVCQIFVVFAFFSLVVWIEISSLLRIFFLVDNTREHKKTTTRSGFLYI